MTKREYDTLLRAIRNIYPTFRGFEDLLNYKYDEVHTNFLKHSGTEEPSYDELVEGLRYENEPDVWMVCDLCKNHIHYTTWDDFDKHHRKCEKIDFINRQAIEIKGEGIDFNKYRSMSDAELNQRYKKIMDNYLQTAKEFTPSTL